MPNFDLLGSLMYDLHQEFVRIYYLMLPLFFALSVAMTWFRSPQGSIEFLDVLKRAVVSTLLLAAFPDISRAILFVTEGITERIDSLNSLDTIIRMAEEKAQSYSLSAKSILLQFDDLIIASLSFISYLILFVARYLTIAMYHFFWTFFMVAAPLLLLFNMFGSTSQVAKNLFRGMIEVASWKIVWAILGAMLSSLAFGEAYRAEGSYLVIMVMNLVIAIAMLATPLMVKSLVGSGLQSMSATIGSIAVASMVAAPAKLTAVGTASRSFLNSSQTFMRAQTQKFKRPN